MGHNLNHGYGYCTVPNRTGAGTGTRTGTVHCTQLHNATVIDSPGDIRVVKVGGWFRDLSCDTKHQEVEDVRHVGRIRRPL